MPKLSWWRTDNYWMQDAVPIDLVTEAGPKGVALVRAWPDGRTDPGWGLAGGNGEGFGPRYNRGEFNAKRILYGYERDKWAFAFIMRSLKVLCVDIDGKNGGFEHAGKLGLLPPTLAETSKSGNGYHLFYLHDEPWLGDAGFGEISDRIGVEQGVDVRAVGCVYHYPSQRWNDKRLAPAPKQLIELLKHRDQKVQASNQRIASVLASGDPLEVLLMNDEFERDLAKPIPAGKRNNTLFAIGSKMATAGISGWETKVGDRAQQVGLPDEEITKLIANITRYAGTPATP